MSHFKNIIIAVLVGIFLAGITSQISSSNYPPCDLVVTGIGISTYGCTDTTSATYPCQSESPNSQSMVDCIQQNYYRTKTFPFGFKQHFGHQSNLVDSKPFNQNRIATFTLGFAVTIGLLYVFQNTKIKSAQSAKQSRRHPGQAPR